MRNRRLLSGVLATGLVGLVTAGGWWAVAGEGGGTAGKASPPADAALERARREVRLLDDLYKTAVVLINDTYVDDNSPAAGEAARLLFAAMKKKGWHEARLVDATGEPLNADNRPADAFERKAIEKIVAGEAAYEEVVESDGKRVLRAATVVPVVNQKCATCHPGNKVGDVLGAISYKLVVE